MSTTSENSLLQIYVEFLGLNPYAFFGINYLEGNYQSNKIWTAFERAQVLRAMLITKQEMEENLGYLLLADFSIDEAHVYTGRATRLNHAYVIALGTATTTDLDDVNIDYDTEPATVQITTEDFDTIHLFHPTTGAEISPSQRSYDAGVLTLFIPRYVLLVDENNSASGWDYNDLANFITAVQVKSIVVDDTTAIQSGYTLEMTNYKMGLAQASYSLTVAPDSETMLINYQSGLEALDYALKNAWVDFAHARMDIQPTVDPVVSLKWLWARDIPQQMSDTQRDCSFGQFAGAYQAYRYVNSHRLHRTTPL